MTSLGTGGNEMPINHIEIFIHCNDIEVKPSQHIEENNMEYSQITQRLLAAVCGAKKGLVLVTLLMMGVEILNEDITIILLAGLAGLVAGACILAIEEFVSVDTQLEIEVAQMKVHDNKHKEVENDDEGLNPFQASIASAIGYSIGAAVPMLAAVFIRDCKMRMLVVAVAMLALLVFGGIGVVLGKSKTPVRRTWDQNDDWRLDDYGYYFWL